MKQVRLTESQIEQALIKSKGIISFAAESLQVARSTIDRRIQKSAKLQELVREQREVILDRAEAALFQQIEAGEAWAVKYLLTNFGRARGYGNQTKNPVEDAPVQIIIREEVISSREQLEELENKSKNRIILNELDVEKLDASVSGYLSI